MSNGRRLARPRNETTPALEAVYAIVKMAHSIGMTTYALARTAGVDPRYMARLLDGSKRNPSRDVLIRLSMAIDKHTSVYSRKDVDRVLKIAGFPPTPEHMWRDRTIIIMQGRGFSGYETW